MDTVDPALAGAHTVKVIGKLKDYTGHSDVSKNVTPGEASFTVTIRCVVKAVRISSPPTVNEFERNAGLKTFDMTDFTVYPACLDAGSPTYNSKYFKDGLTMSLVDSSKFLGFDTTNKRYSVNAVDDNNGTYIIEVEGSFTQTVDSKPNKNIATMKW